MLNQQLRSDLLRIPRPADADDVRVTRRDGLWFTGWVTGRDCEPFGPGFERVADAIAAARIVREGHGLV